MNRRHFRNTEWGAFLGPVLEVLWCVCKVIDGVAWLWNKLQENAMTGGNDTFHVGPLTGNYTEMKKSVMELSYTNLHDPAKQEVNQMLDDIGPNHMMSMEIAWRNRESPQQMKGTESFLTLHDVHEISTPPAG